MSEQIILPNAFDRMELQRMRRKLDNVNGPGVTNSPDSITIRLPRSGASNRDRDEATPLKITAYLGGRGEYEAVRGIHAKAIAEGTDFSEAALEWDTEIVVFVNYAENAGGVGSHALAIGAMIDGFAAGAASDANRPVYQNAALGLPDFQYQRMVGQMVAQHVWGGDFVIAHPMLTAVS